MDDYVLFIARKETNCLVGVGLGYYWALATASVGLIHLCD